MFLLNVCTVKPIRLVLSPYLRTPNPGVNPEFIPRIRYINGGVNPGLNTEFGVLRCGPWLTVVYSTVYDKQCDIKVKGNQVITCVELHSF
jgi:hypothetical protein